MGAAAAPLDDAAARVIIRMLIPMVPASARANVQRKEVELRAQPPQP